MANETYKARSKRPLGAQNFTVKVAGKDNDVDNPIDFSFGVSSVEGLNTGSINVIETRSGGDASAHREIFPGTFTTAPITLTGVYLADMSDLVKLKNWWNECADQVNHPLRGYLRDVSIFPTFFDRQGAEIDVAGNGQFNLSNCMLLDLSLSAFSIDAQEAQKWSMQIKYEKLLISNGSGEVV